MNGLNRRVPFAGGLDCGEKNESITSQGGAGIRRWSQRYRHQQQRVFAEESEIHNALYSRLQNRLHLECNFSIIKAPLLIHYDSKDAIIGQILPHSTPITQSATTQKLLAIHSVKYLSHDHQ
jgi:hypothetical protein